MGVFRTHQLINHSKVERLFSEEQISEFAKRADLIVTDCLKEDKTITLSAHQDSEPIFTFVKQNRGFIMQVETQGLF